MRAVVAI